MEAIRETLDVIGSSVTVICRLASLLGGLKSSSCPQLNKTVPGRPVSVGINLRLSWLAPLSVMN